MEIIGSSKHDHDHDHEIINNNNDNNKGGVFSCGWSRLKVAAKRLRDKGCEIVKKTKKVGEDDPRRVIHSVKVGIALSLVSLFYYYQPLYDNFGVSAMWAIMTVVVVFEFSVGATLGKGLNRGLATLLAGALGVGAHHLASLTGQIGEPILLGFFVFLQAASSTFVRFFPKIKARYDYGMLIFILTFCLISVSGFRNDEILEMAHQRLSTILIGGFACVAISIFVCPVWAGEDLHNLIALNLEKLGNFLEGFGDEYFNISGNKDSDNNNNKDLNKAFLQGYKSVLNSKSSEESLANFAKWEPGHGRFKYRHPWDQYLKVANLARQCAYRIEALHTRLLNPHDLQVSAEVKGQIKEACTQISLETGKTLKELSRSVKKMVRPSSVDSHTANSKTAAKSLRSLLKSGLLTTKKDTNDSNNNNIIVVITNIDLLEVIPSVTVASILLDVVNCTELIAESVHELASLAHFKSTLGKSDTVSHEEAIVTIAEPAPTSQVIDSNGATTPRIGV